MCGLRILKRSSHLLLLISGSFLDPEVFAKLVVAPGHTAAGDGFGMGCRSEWHRWDAGCEHCWPRVGMRLHASLAAIAHILELRMRKSLTGSEQASTLYVERTNHCMLCRVGHFRGPCCACSAAGAIAAGGLWRGAASERRPFKISLPVSLWISGIAVSASATPWPGLCAHAVTSAGFGAATWGGREDSA